MKKLSFLLLLCFAFISAKIPKEFKDLKKEYAFIPSGIVYYNTDRVLSKRLNNIAVSSEKDSLKAFLIAKNEVSNGEYKEFLKAIRKSDTSKYNDLLPDTTVWRQRLAYNEPFVQYYFRHPAYTDYPVVGITKAQAEAYCSWLTQKLNKERTKHKVIARLPNKTEWIRAARGDKSWAYALGGSLRNDKGVSLYNFSALGDESIHYNADSMKYEVTGTARSGGLITVTKDSYLPNQWGLYNVCGNVAELIADEDIAMGGGWNSPGYDIRVESSMPSYASANIGFRVLLEIQE